MRLTVKGTARGMLRITVTDMMRINGKCIVRCMLIITLKGTVTHSYLPTLSPLERVSKCPCRTVDP